jgi:DNA-binding transcriptional regulator YiaG
MQGQPTVQDVTSTPDQEAPARPENPPVVVQWSGREIRALRLALRMTTEEFAGHLGVSPRTAYGWNTRPDQVPILELQRALDTVLAHAPDPARQRFVLALAGAR